MQPGLHKVDTGCIKSNDAENFEVHLKSKSIGLEFRARVQGLGFVKLPRASLNRTSHHFLMFLISNLM